MAVNPAATPAPDRDRRIARALALLAFLTVAVVAPVLDAKAAATTFFDDAFYYFQIARNVARGAGFTFDGLHGTSGFHPLWLMMQVPLFLLLSGDVPPLGGVILLEAALVATTTATVFRTLLPRVGRGAALVTALLLLVQPGAPRILRGGMESALVLCLFAVVWKQWLALRDDAAAPLRRWWRLGACCALFFLARLEGAVVVPIIAVLAWPRLRQDARRALALMAPLALSASIYLAWTRWTFGTWGPVSAFAKAQIGGAAWAKLSTGEQMTHLLYFPWGFEPHVDRLLRWVGVTSLAPPLAGTLAMLALLAAAAWQRHRLLPPLRKVGFTFVAATTVVMLVIDKVGVRLMVDWYRVPSLLALALLGGALVGAQARLARAAVLALAIVALARVPQPLWYLRFSPAYQPEGLQVAGWMRPRLQAGAVAGSWNSGLIGYFAGGRVVNLDGLANDAAFLREVVNGGDLAGYLERERVRFLVDNTTPEGRLAPLVRRYPRAVAEAVEAGYVQVAAFYASCPPEIGWCPPLTIWERKGQPRSSRPSPAAIPVSERSAPAN
jgi:hypothetical protein